MGISVRLIADQISPRPNSWGIRMMAKPTTSEIHWYWRTEMPGWSAHLVKVHDISGNMLKFLGVKLEDVDVTFGPEPGDDSKYYEVNLTELRHVYPLQPGSLDGYVQGSENCYAILLLSEYYRTGKDRNQQYPDVTPRDPHNELRFARTTGGPKYPASQGIDDIEELKKKLAESDKRYDKAIAEAQEIFASLGMKANPKVADWAKNWSR